MSEWKRHRSIKDEPKVSEKPLYTKRQKMKMLIQLSARKGKQIARKTRYHGTKAIQSYKYKYLCPYEHCTYATNNKANMSKHMRDTHKGTAPITKSRYYKFIK